MKNRIIKTLIFNKQLRLYLINNTELIEEILQIKEQSNIIINTALANSVTIATLLSATLKGNQRLSTTLTMSNPKYKIHTDADAHGNIRGYANNYLLSQGQYKTIKQLIGLKGAIRMIKGVDMNQFTGITDMPYQNIDKDFAHYFKQSEQTDTLFKTHVDWEGNGTIKNSYGFYAQLLPNSSEGLLKIVEEKSEMLISILKGLPHSTEVEVINLLNRYFSGVEFIGYSSAQFFCGCSKAMFYGLLHSIDKSELKEYVQTGKSITSTCNICGRNYHFNTDEMKTYLREGSTN
jgi:molecular chaperone Hsp33